jgi:crossover junction endodeoxyribonuclease RuvC
MTCAGIILALDLGTRCGFAHGAPGDVPTSGAVLLKKKGEPADMAFGNFIAFLQQTFESISPSLVVKEAPFSLQAFSDRGNSEAGVLMAFGLHAITRGMCNRYGIACEQAYAATIRKHLLGKARMGTRDATKTAVVDRCKLLGILPADSDDADRADALATHDWACANFGSKAASISNFQLFDQGARQNG